MAEITGPAHPRDGGGQHQSKWRGLHQSSGQFLQPEHRGEYGFSAFRRPAFRPGGRFGEDFFRLDFRHQAGYAEPMVMGFRLTSNKATLPPVP